MEKRVFKIRYIRSKDFKEVRERAMNEIQEYRIVGKVDGKSRKYVARNSYYEVVMHCAYL